MDINKIPVVSSRIYLSDVYPDLAELEGATEDEERAWAVVRRANEADNIRRHEMLGERNIRYVTPNNPIAVSETVLDNSRQRAMMEIYWTVDDLGNVLADGKPLFTCPFRSMPLGEFTQKWHLLPIELATAIYAAVLSYNKEWAKPLE